MVWRWVRHASARHEDAWRERLSVLGPDLVIHGRPGLAMIRLEAYSHSASLLRRVAREFGGQVTRIDCARLVAEGNAPRRPLRLARDLAVIDTNGRWPPDQPTPRVLLRIASAMAFGTGEHATTTACLRFLRDEAATLGPGWTMLDVGTGSGILAIAAEKFGAAAVTAFDNDPRAVAAAQGNARRNRCTRVTLRTADIFRWSPGRAAYPVVMANVFSEILRAAAPKLRRATAPSGCLVLSGILRGQEEETLGTFLQADLTLEKTCRRGKWVTLKLRARSRAPGRA
jgi:ribosomal protein L11 methyltransferase